MAKYAEMGASVNISLQSFIGEKPSDEAEEKEEKEKESEEE